MTYIALLRGINVGGNNKVPMSGLKLAFASLGFVNVKTYINSGNVVFEDDQTISEIQDAINKKLQKTYNFPIKTLIISSVTFSKIAAAIPDDWQNDKITKCDVLFLWPEINTPAVIDQLGINSVVDTIIYQDGAVIWKVQRSLLLESSMTKFTKSHLYKKVTIRNCNTVRKLADINI